MLTHPHLLGRETDEMNGPRSRSANYVEQERREASQRIIATSENPNVSPRVEIMFNRQEEDVFVSTTISKLGAIGVLSPADAVQQRSRGGMKRDEVAAATMIWTEDQRLRSQLRKCALNVDCAQPRAIPTDGDNFLIAKLRDSLQRVLKARREIPTRLPVGVRSVGDGCSGRREKMKINLWRNLGAEAHFSKKRPCRPGERTPR